MGKKGTKRKTKWRALPLGEDAGGSGNEEDLHDEDQSTTSSVVGGQFTRNDFKRQPVFFKMADKPYRQTRRFTYEKFRCKEPLVKLESKTFDEEEYTKITTPRQDVLFKKGYFGKKRESSVEETTPLTGEVDGEEPLMDQIIITNGFVDERGHYLVNGNSYEIYDPYSNTVTVVVGPPPYANGITHPVLAAVSCQPVPLQPVDWYPPGTDWPSQGSAWTPSFPSNPPSIPVPPSDTVNNTDCVSAFPPSEAPPRHPYDHPPFVLPPSPYLYNAESPHYNGVPLQTNSPTETQSSEENRTEVKKTRRKSMEAVTEKDAEPKQTTEEFTKADKTATGVMAALEKPEILDSLSSLPSPNHDASETPSILPRRELTLTETPQKVEKQSHSTQTNLPEVDTHPTVSNAFGKESHSTQTPSEEVLSCNTANAGAQYKSNKPSLDIPPALPPLLPPPARPEADIKERWERKPYANRYNSAVRKFREESPKKMYHQKTNYTEQRKVRAEKSICGSTKVSYAKKARSGLESAEQRGVSGLVAKAGTAITNGITNGMANGVGPRVEDNGSGNTATGKRVGEAPCEDMRNGFVKAKYGRGRTTNERGWQKYKDRKAEVTGFDDAESKCEEVGSETQSRSEKSSSMSELSSPTELSSGQNTPPEKLIVQKMEQEINKNFEVKLKQNWKTKSEAEEETEVEEVGEKENLGDKSPEKPKGKKKKRKGRVGMEKQREGVTKSGKRRKKRTNGEAKEKAEIVRSEEEVAFLSGIKDREELFAGWEGLKGSRDEGQESISEMGWFLNGDAEILKSLGLDGRVRHSKLPLHSDLLMILPGVGWSRPKLRIEDFFAPASYDSDFFTKRNITNMKSTKPEEFFASVVDNPAVDKPEKKKEPSKKAAKLVEMPPSGKKINEKTASKPPKPAAEPEVSQKENCRKEDDANDGKLGIVEAVNTWLQEQGDSEKVLSVDGLGGLITEEDINEDKNDQKNGESNPIHAPSAEERAMGTVVAAGAPKAGGCIRVANVINDRFVRVRDEYLDGRKHGRIYRSSSWDAKLSEVKIKSHFKFLTDSASFCQDLISDVRNGLPTGNEYATEELCDPKQMVRKYYTLAPAGASRLRSDSDSENEVFDALEYKFLPKDRHEAPPDGKASITDSGVHSDVDLSEDVSTDLHKEKTCKLQ